MFSRCRRLFRRIWAPRSPASHDHVLEAWIDNRWLPCRAVDVRGLMLVCSARSLHGRTVTFLVGETECRDRATFWRIWRRFAPYEIVTGDGTRFDPERLD